MRTAIITALTHADKGVLISGKEVHLLKQLEIFRTFKHAAAMEGSHPDFKEVSYQESDNGEERVTFRTPAAQKEHPAARAQQKKTHLEQVAKQEETEATSRISDNQSVFETTVADFVAAGYNPHDYPPKGYKGISSAAEITVAVEKFDKAAADKAAADKAAADKAAADKAAAETTPNEFNRDELNAKNQGELLAIANGLVTSQRIEAPAKTSKGALIEAILAAKPVPTPNSDLPTSNP